MNTPPKPLRVRPSVIAEQFSEDGDGYWIMLKPGWRWAGDMLAATHAIHEPTRASAMRQYVIPCLCAECAATTTI